MVRVAAFTPGADNGSARFRVRQLIPQLARRGLAVREYPATFGSFPPRGPLGRPAWLMATLGGRALDVARGRGADVTLLQRELISTLPTFEGLTRAPRVLDVDDAIFLYRRGVAARWIARRVDAVIAGNGMIAEWFAQYCSRVSVAPTAVDTERWGPATAAANPSRPVIVWSGSGTGVDLEPIEPALVEVLRRFPGATLRVISNCRPSLPSLPPGRLEFIDWSPTVEVRAVQTATVGIMPLENTEWNRGKCAYKAILYLACGLPVVISPVGMNVEVLARARCGIGASTTDEWVDALSQVLDDPASARAMGAAGRSAVERHYSVDVVAPLVADALLAVA